MSIQKIAVVGGDDRFLWVKNALHGTGNIKDADVLVLPLPVSADGKTVFGCDLLLSDLFLQLSPHAKVLGGNVSESVQKLANRHGFSITDYFKREELTLYNAIPTVEGAVEIAIRESDITLWQSNALVLGYGRIGKMLSRLLKAFGAKVTVCARKQSDLAAAECENLSVCTYDTLHCHIYDFIFNTVPALVLNEKHLLESKQNVLIVDLASRPGGVDFPVAESLSRKAIHALALPGKVAPKTTGMLIAKTVTNILEEEL